MPMRKTSFKNKALRTLPTGIRIYLSGLALYRALKKYDRNIFQIVRLLDAVRRNPRWKSSAAGLARPHPLTGLIHGLSPWMWGHRCLYRSLLYYLWKPGDMTINIGVTIQYQKKEFGHCWIIADGEAIDSRDEGYTSYFSRPLSHKNNIYYWLPVEAGGIKLPEHSRRSRATREVESLSNGSQPVQTRSPHRGAARQSPAQR